MNLEYDKTADALYVTVTGEGEVQRTFTIDAGTLVDLGADGEVIGIEVLNPGRPWVGSVVQRYDLAPDVVRRLTQLQAVGIYSALGEASVARASMTSSTGVMVST
jgi:uncharacterized protein YuzE